jgi:hypothetical protein
MYSINRQKTICALEHEPRAADLQARELIMVYSFIATAQQETTENMFWVINAVVLKGTFWPCRLDLHESGTIG